MRWKNPRKEWIVDLLSNAQQEAKRSVCADCSGRRGCDEDACGTFQNETQSILADWELEKKADDYDSLEQSHKRTIGAIKKFCAVGIGKGNKGFKHEYERGIRKMAEQVLKLIKELEKSEEKNDI